MIEMRPRAGKITGLGKRAEMQLIEDDLLPTATTPAPDPSNHGPRDR